MTPRLRLTAFGGTSAETLGRTVASDPSAGGGYVEDYSGPFGGARFAYEGQRFGVGVSLVHVSGYDGFTAPGGYLRLGNIDRAHLDLEGLPPGPVFPATGWARMGIGFNHGHLRGTGGFLGLGYGPFDYNAKITVIGEVEVPLGTHMTGIANGLIGPGENTPQWSTGVGLRVDFGNP